MKDVFLAGLMGLIGGAILASVYLYSIGGF